jgi:hypothetical protein
MNGRTAQPAAAAAAAAAHIQLQSFSGANTKASCFNIPSKPAQCSIAAQTTFMPSHSSHTKSF